MSLLPEQLQQSLQSWLQQYLVCPASVCRTLCVVGPLGCGKTTAVRAQAEQLSLQILSSGDDLTSLLRRASGGPQRKNMLILVEPAGALTAEQWREAARYARVRKQHWLPPLVLIADACTDIPSKLQTELPLLQAAALSQTFILQALRKKYVDIADDILQAAAKHGRGNLRASCNIAESAGSAGMAGTMRMLPHLSMAPTLQALHQRRDILRPEHVEKMVGEPELAGQWLYGAALSSVSLPESIETLAELLDEQAELDVMQYSIPRSAYGDIAVWGRLVRRGIQPPCEEPAVSIQPPAHRRIVELLERQRRPSDRDRTTAAQRAELESLYMRMDQTQRKALKRKAGAQL